MDIRVTSLFRKAQLSKADKAKSKFDAYFVFQFKILVPLLSSVFYANLDDTDDVFPYSCSISLNRLHTGETPYQCTYCGKKFTRKEHLTNHVRWETEFSGFNRILICNLAELSFRLCTFLFPRLTLNYFSQFSSRFPRFSFGTIGYIPGKLRSSALIARRNLREKSIWRITRGEQHLLILLCSDCW